MLAVETRYQFGEWCEPTPPHWELLPPKAYKALISACSTNWDSSTLASEPETMRASSLKVLPFSKMLASMLMRLRGNMGTTVLLTRTPTAAGKEWSLNEACRWQVDVHVLHSGCKIPPWNVGCAPLVLAGGVPAASAHSALWAQWVDFGEKTGSQRDPGKTSW